MMGSLLLSEALVVSSKIQNEKKNDAMELNPEMVLHYDHFWIGSKSDHFEILIV